ncbi:Carbohydrate-binding-like fold [Cynara cardunculus var. scolymus]|uniref:4-alpha-glucanotransferase n=1 Tax=Cynara cardunculus var. scolymus TaxID=59895 RepID=A0A118K7G2_CYNCS|nr:Carbohydrate-binding-like fold [Cynara cardunculus var. scolymus]
MVNLGLFSEIKPLLSVNVRFRIPYYTQWGQSLVVCGSEPVLGSGNVKKGLLLTPFHEGDELIWGGSLAVPAGFQSEYNYYVVDDERNVIRWEVGNKRKLVLPVGIENGKVVELHDLWLNGSDSLPSKSAFKNVIFRKSSKLAIEKPLGTIQNKLDDEDSIILQFKICCPNIADGTSVIVFSSNLSSKLLYKHIYVIGSSEELGRWKVHDGLKLNYVEYGSNREITVDISASGPNYLILSDGMMREMPWRGAGVAIPMFSVRSEDDVGVGEFLDLKLVVDWAVDSGFHLLQLLPINDTSVHKMWWDSYPYRDTEGNERARRKDYEATMATKLSIAKKIFDLEKDLILNSSNFKNFLTENEEWLNPYAAFCFLRDFFETSDHSQWGTFSQFSKDKLSEAAEYAKEKGVVLKGDLPIGVDRNSVDTWVYPNLFRMNTATGAPPDYFDKNGQNWGFPTYNWEEMSKDNYAWWRARLSQMANYFTAYRIDHILGFFRIWELPEHAMTGLVGKFRPSIPLSQEELEKEGVWDFDRLSKPYILQEFLQEKFGPSWIVVASHFMNEFQKNRYEFKDDCNTERKIAAKLKSLVEKSLLLESEEKLRRDLFDLLQNIVLIRDPEDPRSFYPRFNLEDTKNIFRRLYYDYYFQRQESLWRQNAMKTLPALLNSSDMLACGEDLGLIPSCVHPVMQELGLIGLRIQRMPSEADLDFGIPSQYGYMTVCAPSCHDCSTLRAWWEEDEERRRLFFKTMVGSDSLPPKQCVPEIAYFVLRQHDLLALKEEYTTRPAVEETINDPTNPKHYWRFRVHVTMETLLKDAELTTAIKGLVCGSARSYPGEQVQNLSAVTEKQQEIGIKQEKIRLPNQDPKITSIAVL